MIQSPSIGDAHDAGEDPLKPINNPVNRNIQGLYFFDFNDPGLKEDDEPINRLRRR